MGDDEWRMGCADPPIPALSPVPSDSSLAPGPTTRPRSSTCYRDLVFRDPRLGTRGAGRHLAEWTGASSGTGLRNLEELDIFPLGGIPTKWTELIGDPEDPTGLYCLESKIPGLIISRQIGRSSGAHRCAAAMSSMPSRGPGRGGACPHGLPAGYAGTGQPKTSTSKFLLPWQLVSCWNRRWL